MLYLFLTFMSESALTRHYGVCPIQALTTAGEVGIGSSVGLKEHPWEGGRKRGRERVPGHMLHAGPARPSPACLGLAASLGLLLLLIEGRLFMRPAQILVTSPCCPG